MPTVRSGVFRFHGVYKEGGNIDLTETRVSPRSKGQSCLVICRHGVVSFCQMDTARFGLATDATMRTVVVLIILAVCTIGRAGQPWIGSTRTIMSALPGVKRTQFRDAALSTHDPKPT